MKRSYIIKKVKQVYLQICIPKIFKPIFENEMRNPKLIFRDKGKTNRVGFTNGREIYINIKSIYNAYKDEGDSVVLGNIVYYLIHESVHNIQGCNIDYYKKWKMVYNYIECECDNTTINIFNENIDMINQILKSDLVLIPKKEHLEKYVDIRNGDMNRNLMINLFSRIIHHTNLKKMLSAKYIHLNIVSNKSIYLKEPLLEDGVLDKRLMNKIRHLAACNKYTQNKCDVIDNGSTVKLYLRFFGKVKLKKFRF